MSLLILFNIHELVAGSLSSFARNWFFRILHKLNWNTTMMLKWFWHDDDPSRNTLAVRYFLDEEFTNSYIGRCASVLWSPCSLHLTILDFFLRITAINKVYKRTYRSISDLSKCCCTRFEEYIEKKSLKVFA